MLSHVDGQDELFINGLPFIYEKWAARQQVKLVLNSQLQGKLPIFSEFEPQNQSHMCQYKIRSIKHILHGLNIRTKLFPFLILTTLSLSLNW